MSLTSLTSVASKVTQYSLQPPSTALLRRHCVAGSGTARQLLRAGGGSGKTFLPLGPLPCVLEPRPLMRPLITPVPVLRESEPAERTPRGSDGRAHGLGPGPRVVSRCAGGPDTPVAASARIMWARIMWLMRKHRGPDQRLSGVSHGPVLPVPRPRQPAHGRQCHSSWHSSASSCVSWGPVDGVGVGTAG